MLAVQLRTFQNPVSSKLDELWALKPRFEQKIGFGVVCKLIGFSFSSLIKANCFFVYSFCPAGSSRYLQTAISVGSVVLCL